MTWKKFCETYGVPLIYRDCSLENLDVFPNQEGINFIDAGMHFCKHPVSTILQGDTGRGKTHFMYALMRELVDGSLYEIAEIQVISSVDLDQKISDEIALYHSCTNYIERLCEIPLLFIDDFGAEGGKERAERNFYTIIEKRLSNRKPTIFSTNLTDAEILSIFGSRIESRLRQCVKLIFDGPDLRKPNFIYGG